MKKGEDRYLADVCLETLRHLERRLGREEVICANLLLRMEGEHRLADFLDHDEALKEWVSCFKRRKPYSKAEDIKKNMAGIAKLWPDRWIALFGWQR